MYSFVSVNVSAQRTGSVARGGHGARPRKLTPHPRYLCVKGRELTSWNVECGRCVSVWKQESTCCWNSQHGLTTRCLSSRQQYALTMPHLSIYDVFYTILDHNFYSLTEVMLYKRLVSKKRCCTRKPRYKVCRWRDVECCVICGLPSPPTSINRHNLNSDYFPIRFAFPNQTSSVVPKKVILVVQYSDEIQDIQDIHIHIQDHIQDSPISRMRWSGRQTSSESSGSSFWKSERLFTFFNCLLQPLTLFWIEVIHNTMSSSNS